MDSAKRKTNAAALSVASNSLLIILKVVVGLSIGSVAVFSEAVHSAVDLVAAGIALFAVRASSRGADERHPYGHGKFENISGTIEALLIFVAAVWIIYEAVQKLIHPQEIEMLGWGVGVMLVSALVNIFVSKRLFKVAGETDSVALRADALAPAHRRLHLGGSDGGAARDLAGGNGSGRGSICGGWTPWWRSWSP